MRTLLLDKAPFHSIAYQTSASGGRVRDAELPFFRASAQSLSGTGSIIVCSDLQGRIDGQLLGVALADELRLLVEVGEIEPPNTIILVGDLYDHPELAKLGASGDVAEVFEALREIAPVVGVLGNHDRLDQCPSDCTVLDGDVCELDGLTIGGVSGIIGQSKRPMRRSADEFQKLVKRVLAKRPDVLLLHQGPPGSNPTQRGSEEVLVCLNTKRAMTLFCGHCHWDDPSCVVGDLQIVNVDARVFVISAPR